jgi:hypothetical protein
MADDPRQALLDALELCEALRPFTDPGNPKMRDTTEAWALALDNAREAARQYVAAVKKGTST